MKLILTQEVDGLGSAGDVVDVKDGYGRNYLIPRGFAQTWTRGGQKTVDAIQRSRQARAVRDADHAAEVQTALQSQTFQVKVRAGEGGRLYGAVTASDIAEALAEAGTEIDRRSIMIESPIRSLGTHSVTVRLHEEVTAAVNLNVVPS